MRVRTKIDGSGRARKFRRWYEISTSTGSPPPQLLPNRQSASRSPRKNVARGLVPRPGGAWPAHTTIPHPNHPNILDIQHRYSSESRSPGVGESRSAGAWSQPRIRHPAIYIRLRGPRKAILTPANAGVQRGEGTSYRRRFSGPTARQSARLGCGEPRRADFVCLV